MSEAIRVAFGEMFGIELVQNAAVCYNPLEAKTIRRMAEGYEVAHDKFTICAVGRVIPEKGFLRLSSFCEHMVEDGRDFTLNIVGDGKEYDRLKEMVESHHLEKWEHLIGFQENPYPYIKNADLFVCSSLNEGYNLLTLKQLSPVRLVKNDFFKQVEEAESRGATTDELRTLLGKGRAKKGIFEGDLFEGELEIGQVASCIHKLQTVDEVMKELVEDFNAALNRVNELKRFI